MLILNSTIIVESRFFAIKRVIWLSWRELNPYRLSAHPFGYFRLFCLDGRQPTCIKESRKYLEKRSRQVSCSFVGADFCSGKAKLAENTVVLSKALTQHGRKSARQNRYAFDSRQLNVHYSAKCFCRAYWKLSATVIYCLSSVWKGWGTYGYNKAFRNRKNQQNFIQACARSEEHTSELQSR